jgi:hypothetical protein
MAEEQGLCGVSWLCLSVCLPVSKESTGKEKGDALARRSCFTKPHTHLICTFG